ncbi:MAG: BBP7 family outer membrane beta-barrel protein [Planctomycetes bacterium]|nr:BBP7 family outer membrane beta-barrel protein [Planctomycetota bacterium]
MRNGFRVSLAVSLLSTTFLAAQQLGVPAEKPIPEMNLITFQAGQPAKASQIPAELGRVFNAAPVDPIRFWVNADYLLWWVKDGPISSPIVTTTTSLTDLPPGAVGQPGTRVAFGDRPIDYGTFSGLRVGAGFDLGGGLSLEGSYFALERRAGGLILSSDAAGSPAIGISTFNPVIGIEDALLTSNPDPVVGIWTGTAVVASRTRLQGWELNLGLQGMQTNTFAFKWIAGFRAIDLNEDLVVQNTFTPLVGGNLTFNGAGVPAGTVLTDHDRFHATNHFYGGQVGGHAQWRSGALSLDVVGKIAFGYTQQVVNIDGASTMTPPGGTTTVAPGGVYAQLTNIGRHYQSSFAVSPEVGIGLGWNLTDAIRAKVGYSLLYLSRVARPGAQVNHTVDQTLIPTHQAFGLTPPVGQPTFAFRETDFWAQGINFGLEFMY